MACPRRLNYLFPRVSRRVSVDVGDLVQRQYVVDNPMVMTTTPLNKSQVCSWFLVMVLRKPVPWTRMLARECKHVARKLEPRRSVRGSHDHVSILLRHFQHGSGAPETLQSLTQPPQHPFLLQNTIRMNRLRISYYGTSFLSLRNNMFLGTGTHAVNAFLIA